MPKRIQRQRTRGWRMPPGAIYVGRPTLYGNYHPVGHVIDGTSDWYLRAARKLGLRPGDRVATVEQSIALFRAYMKANDTAMLGDFIKKTLRGHDLACWCPLGKPCHADVLLELANK